MKNIGKNRRFLPREPQNTQNVDVAPDSGPKAKKPKTFKRTELDESMYLQPEEVQSLFRVITNKRDRAMFRLAYHRGMRAHEIGLLELSDFRNRDGVLFVRRGKGSISREHSLTTNELIAVRAWVKERGTMPGPLFPSRQGGGISRYRLDDLMKEYCKKAGIRREKAHMHALKHSCGTHLRERGESADSIQDWLGHRDSKSTDIYLHFSRRRRQEAVERNRDW